MDAFAISTTDEKHLANKQQIYAIIITVPSAVIRCITGSQAIPFDLMSLNAAYNAGLFTAVNEWAMNYKQVQLNSFYFHNSLLKILCSRHWHQLNENRLLDIETAQPYRPMCSSCEATRPATSLIVTRTHPLLAEPKLLAGIENCLLHAPPLQKTKLFEVLQT